MNTNSSFRIPRSFMTPKLVGTVYLFLGDPNLNRQSEVDSLVEQFLKKHTDYKYELVRPTTDDGPWAISFVNKDGVSDAFLLADFKTFVLTNYRSSDTLLPASAAIPN